MEITFDIKDDTLQVPQPHFDIIHHVLNISCDKNLAKKLSVLYPQLKHPPFKGCVIAGKTIYIKH